MKMAVRTALATILLIGALGREGSAAPDGKRPPRAARGELAAIPIFPGGGSPKPGEGIPSAPRSDRGELVFPPSPAWGNSFVRDRLEGGFVNLGGMLDWLGDWSDFDQEYLVLLPRKTGIGLVTFYAPINSTLADCSRLPVPGEAVEDWADMDYLGNLIDVLDFCSLIGVRAEIDLATNCWVPSSVDAASHISAQTGVGCWPVPDDDPWDEAIAWTSGLIEHVEASVADPESIALWTLTGNYTSGMAEPALWDSSPEVMSATREFVRNVWPAFAAAGSRPKGIICLPILLRDYPSAARLSAFTNLIEYLDGLPAPDYLVVTSYGGMDSCAEWTGQTRDILREIVDLADAAWPGGSRKIIMSDFKWEESDLADTIVSRDGMSRSDVFRWHFAACDRYRLAGWWWWWYIGSPRGILGDHGWNEDLVDAVAARTLRTDIAIFRPPEGLWSIRGGERAYFGGADSSAVPADYDGDGRSEMAVFDPHEGRWRVRGKEPIYFGREGDVPIPADYFGDGRAAAAVFRPSDGLWAVRDLTRAHFGSAGDLPVPADYDGDGRDDLAFFRPAEGLWYVRGVTRLVFGSASDLPAPADYSGAGKAAFAVFRPAAGGWKTRGTGAWTYFGGPADLPVPGDYDGDGSAERALFRPATGEWLVAGGLRTVFGRAGDVPVSVNGAIVLSGPAGTGRKGGGR